MQKSNPSRLGRYPVGAIVQRRNGVQFVKTDDSGLIPVARAIAAQSTRVINGGHELAKNEMVYHLDMTSHGDPDHDRPENLVVIKRRTTKYQMLSRSRLIFLPKTKPAKEKTFK